MANDRETLRIDLFPSPATLARERTGVDKAELERLVEIKVAEIMADRDAMIFEPFFRSRQVSYEIKRLQTVPEQEKFRIYYERYGCMCCETKERIHAGNGMCNTCRTKRFQRLAQIVAEGMKGEPAQPARGASREVRQLPPGSIRDGVHRTVYQRSTKGEKALYTRVALELGVDPGHVRLVAIGSQHSERVSAALKEERLRMHLFGGSK
jgi:hypothetical protein